MVGVNEEGLGDVKLSVIAGDFRVVDVGVIVVIEEIVDKDSQSPKLQISVLDKSLDLTSLQYEIQERILVRSPSPHVLLQDDHSFHELYSGGPEKTVSLLLFLLIKNMRYFAIVVIVQRAIQNKSKQLTVTGVTGFIA